MELLAQGRACDVFAVDDVTVLRRERAGRSLAREAEVMRHVRAAGFPCPEVIDVQGADMTMERIDGRTLTEFLLATPTPAHLVDGARLLARLHRQLHEVAPMPGAEGSVLHLDLHPDNVLVTPGGPVVIDWTNATHGEPALDIATTWVILEPFARADAVVRMFVDTFVAAAGRDDARRGLPAAVALRLADRNVTDTEKTVARDLLARHA